MIGKTISHYRIVKKLGEGGMGVVYGAEDTTLKRAVALKFLPQEMTRHPEAKARFFHEAQAAAALSHPNICTIYEIGEADDQSFIVMDLIEGGSLKDRIERGPLALTDAVEVATQIAEGLTAAHNNSGAIVCCQAPMQGVNNPFASRNRGVRARIKLIKIQFSVLLNP